MISEQQRGCHADHAAADDQHWNLDIGIEAHVIALVRVLVTPFAG